MQRDHHQGPLRWPLVPPALRGHGHPRVERRDAPGDAQPSGSPSLLLVLVVAVILILVVILVIVVIIMAKVLIIIVVVAAVIPNYLG